MSGAQNTRGRWNRPHKRPFPTEKVNQTELFYVFSSHWWLRRGEIWILIHIKVKNHFFLSSKRNINRWIMDQLKFTQSSSCSSSLCKRLTVVQQISSVISSRADVCSWPVSSLTDYWPTFTHKHPRTHTGHLELTQLRSFQIYSASPCSKNTNVASCTLAFHFWKMA